MRKLLVLIALAVAASAVPVSAEATPTAPCTVPADTAVLGVAPTTTEFSPAAVPAIGTDMDDTLRNGGFPFPMPPIPQVPYHEESAVVFNYIVDLSGSTAAASATTGNVTLDLGWDNESDFDVYVYGADGSLIGHSTAFNPMYGAGETATLADVPHCTLLRVDIVNYAGIATSAMTLNTSLKGLK